VGAGRLDSYEVRIYYWMGMGMVAIDTRRSKSGTTLFNENACALLNNHGQIPPTSRSSILVRSYISVSPLHEAELIGPPPPHFTPKKLTLYNTKQSDKYTVPR
jgi:hypothetical protein